MRPQFVYGLILICAFPATSALADPVVQFVDLSGSTPSHQVGEPGNGNITGFVDLDGTTFAAKSPSSSPVHMYFSDLTTGQRREVTDGPSALARSRILAADEAADPWEDFNRDHFGSHVFLQANLIDPVEDVYIGATPRFLRAALHNFLSNLETPKILANDILQADIPWAGATTIRFAVNSTVGVGGLIDVARPLGVPFHDNDFGMTLARYGVGDRPYLLVPVVGPSNPRDIAGKVVDVFLDPLEYVTVPGGILTSLGHTAADQLDKRSRDAGRLHDLTETAADPYAAERHEAREKRQAEIDGEIAD